MSIPKSPTLTKTHREALRMLAAQESMQLAMATVEDKGRIDMRLAHEMFLLGLVTIGKNTNPAGGGLVKISPAGLRLHTLALS